MTPNDPETATPNNADSANPRTGPTGPRTPAGKIRCRFNAVSHGLTSRVLLFEGDEADHYRDHCTGIHNHYSPVGPIEEALVRQIADGIYRLDRASAIEHGIFAFTLGDKGEVSRIERASAPAQTWLDEATNLALLTLYVKRIENKLTANKTELKQLQDLRKQEAAELESKPSKPQEDLTRPPQAPESVFSPGTAGSEMRASVPADGSEPADCANVVPFPRPAATLVFVDATIQEALSDLA